MGDIIDHTRLHRTAKYFMDSGRVQTHEQALALLQGFGLTVFVGPSLSRNADEQIALLTLVNAGRRTFLGGVEVIGVGEDKPLVSLTSAPTLRQAVADLGGKVGSTPNPLFPAAIIGDIAPASLSAPAWRVAWQVEHLALPVKSAPPRAAAALS